MIQRDGCARRVSALVALARICPQVVEFGPPNASIHQIDEHVRRDDVDVLKNIYRRVLENLESLERRDPA